MRPTSLPQAKQFAERRRGGGRLQPGGGHDRRRGTETEHPLYALAEGGGLVRSALASARVALLFGSEKTGLSNDALSHCHWLMTIPMHQSPGLRHASMNLGQAAAVCLYELIRQSDAPPLNEPQPWRVREDLERITELLAEVLASYRICQAPAGQRGTAPKCGAWYGA